MTIIANYNNLNSIFTQDLNIAWLLNMNPSFLTAIRQILTSAMKPALLLFFRTSLSAGLRVSFEEEHALLHDANLHPCRAARRSVLGLILDQSQFGSGQGGPDGHHCPLDDNSYDRCLQPGSRINVIYQRFDGNALARQLQANAKQYRFQKIIVK